MRCRAASGRFTRCRAKSRQNQRLGATFFDTQHAWDEMVGKMTPAAFMERYGGTPEQAVEAHLQAMPSLFGWAPRGRERREVSQWLVEHLHRKGYR